MKLLLLGQLIVVSGFAQGPGLIYAVGAGNPGQDLPNIYGGYRADSVTGVAVDAAGSAYITGNTYSPEFPASADIGPPPFIPPPTRAFVAKLSPDGSRYLYKVLIEGAISHAIAVDQSGSVVIVGETNGFIEGAPTSLNLQVPGWRNAFVAKLNQTGSAFSFAAYFGSSRDTSARAIALDSGGNIYFTGTAADNFPVTAGAYNAISQGCNTFAGKLNPSGTTLVYSAVLGGSCSVNGIAVDRAGSAYIAGAAGQNLITTPGALQTRSNGGSDGFVIKLSAAGDALLYSTYLGGGFSDTANAIAVDAVGNAYVSGSTSSDNFPLTGTALRFEKASAFITKLNSTGSSLLYSTYFDATAINAIAVDTAGNAYFSGVSTGTLPIVHAVQPSFFGGVCTDWTSSGTLPTGFSTCSDAFVAALNTSGSALLFSTHLSGYQKDAGTAIALDAQSNVYVGGMGMLGIAETNPLSSNGSAFVVKLGGSRVLPYFTRQSTTNGASFGSGLVRPGGAATIFCANLSGTTGVHVKVNGVEAPIYAVVNTGQQQQINFQVPFEASAQDPPQRMNVEVSQNGASAFVTGIKVFTTAPGVFTTDGIYGAIQHGLDYGLVTPAAPAEKGEIVTIYATGLGRVTPACLERHSGAAYASIIHDRINQCDDRRTICADSVFGTHAGLSRPVSTQCARAGEHQQRRPKCGGQLSAGAGRLRAVSAPQHCPCRQPAGPDVYTLNFTKTYIVQILESQYSSVIGSAINFIFAIKTRSLSAFQEKRLMKRSGFVCLLAAATMCAGAWAKDIPFKAVFGGSAGVTPDAECKASKVSIDTRGLVTGLGLVRTIQTHCWDPKGTEFTKGIVSAANSDGDGYTGTYSGKLVPTETSDTDHVYSIDGQFTITGGTGRYADVKGGAIASGLQNTATGAFGLVLSGSITVPDTAPPPAPVNNAPVANAGSDITTGFSEFGLDGSKSSDPDGGTLTYSWRSVGRSATIIGTNVVKPRIQVSAGYGLYTFELTVTDSKGLNSKATVKVMYLGN